VNGFFALVSGVLTGEPQRRQGPKTEFATGSLKVESGAESIYASLLAFGGKFDELLEHTAGASLAVSGRAEITAWTGRDGSQRHGLKIVVEQIAAVKPKRQAAAPRTRGRAKHPSIPLADDRVDDLWSGLAP
jgi:single-stranded DNA-binding protein